ncbi:MAG: methyltransferase domain-containing protein [Candidatus Thiodiazotropha endolucinida]
MKICVSCGSRFNSSGWRCPFCQSDPLKVNGFIAFAPILAQKNDGFNVADFEKLAPLEANNFWFRTRNKLIIWALGKYYPSMTSFLEIGCGTGFVLSGIEQAFPGLKLSASDLHTSGLRFANNRVNRSSLFQMDAREIPFDEEFDVVGAFDVLEHISDDEKVLNEIYRTVRHGGGAIFTVPQHEFLWSQADTQACHERRYGAVELIRKVEEVGFTVEMTTSFVFLLLPLMMLSRLIQRDKNSKHDQLAELKIGGLTNLILEKVLDIERLMIRLGIRLPAGGSRLLIARKI